MFRLLLIIGAGGFFGTILRYLVSKYFQQILFSSFPYGTFIVNITGCLIMGIIYGIAQRHALISDELRLFLTVGFCGGFTTFSTFANENLGFLRDGEFLQFALYTGLTVFLGLIALYLGNLIVKMF